MKYFTPIVICLFIFCGCSKDNLFDEQVRHDLWLLHKGAKLPIVVEGNTQSKIFVVLLHGGPGGSSQIFNSETTAFTDPLEEDYAMVYYDQRNAGLALGDYDEEKLTIEQHVEDLDKVIDLLFHNFSDDIQIFLAGHSWGGYLGTAFLLDDERQLKVKSWMNINGLINRNMNLFHAIERIQFVAEEQIVNNVNVEAWRNILDEIEVEKTKSIMQYDVNLEDNVFDLINLAEVQILRDNLVEDNFDSPFSSIYSDNYDPFRIILTNTGDRDRTLRTQMYVYDTFLDSNLDKINIPCLNIYGYFDVNTPLHQGEYLMNKISTSQNDKELLILNKSGHSTMRNEPTELANEMKAWIEKYR